MNVWKNHKTTGEKREFDADKFAALPAAKKALWEDYTPPEPTPSAQDVFDQQLALGFADATTGLKLKTTESAQQKFTSQVTLLQLASSAGVAPSTVTFWDFADAEQTVPLADFFGLMLRYGLHCQALFAEYAP